MRRPRLRYTLRGLLIILTIFGVWFGVQVNRAHRQKRAVEIIQRYGGYVVYDDDPAPPFATPPPPGKITRIENFIGRDFFHSVVTVRLYSMSPIDLNRAVSELSAHMRHLPRVKELTLQHAYACDAAMPLVAVLPALETLYIPGDVGGPVIPKRSRLTEAGIKQLPVCKFLRRLWIHCGEVDDEALQAIGRQPNLQELFLSTENAQLTDAGMNALANARQLKVLFLRFPLSQPCPVTEVGFRSLSRLNELSCFSIRADGITDAALDDLAATPGLDITTSDRTNWDEFSLLWSMAPKLFP